MKNKFLINTLLIFIFFLIPFVFTSCEPPVNSYSGTFTVSGYYVRYDGVHYKYHCSSVGDVKEIIKYYYPDCFDVTVYRPGTEQTGYLNTIFYATWKSKKDHVQIQ